MHCYNHSEKNAVGICKSCGRALCHSCAAEVGKLVACKDRCESDVMTMMSINQNALQYAKSTKQARYLGPILFIVMGAMFATMGLTYSDIDFAVIVGGVVITIGIALFVIQHKMVKAIKT